MRRLNGTSPSVAVLALLIVGCSENGYHTEIKGNGQGGVEIQRVAIVPTQTQPRASTAPYQHQQLEQQVREQQVLIEELQAQIQRQNEELRRLDQRPTTSSTAR